MARLYGNLVGNRGEATRCGTDRIKAAVRSYKGSVIAKLYDCGAAEPTITIEIAEGSSSYGESVFSGTISELKKKLLKK